MKLLYALPLIFAVSAAGCTWVKVSEGGEGVAVSKRAPVQDCDKLKTLHVQVKDNLVGSVDRSAKKVARELKTLARNEAALEGGNYIVPVTAPKDGRQSFDVYRCN